MINIWFITASLGIADGVADPCGISVLLFLIAYLVDISSKKKVISYGLFYSFVIGLVYFAFMIGLLNIINIIPYTRLIDICVAVLLLIWGIFELKDFFAPGKYFTVEMPHAAKVKAGMLIENISLPAVVILGVLVALADIPCASGYAFAYITYLKELSIIGTTAIFFLVLYNLFMVLPLILIVFALYFGIAKVESIKKKGETIKKYLHMLTGILFILIAILLLI
ncbi:MAG: hypothetical protein ACP5RT_01810 [Candidatus Micrarchaeia archaeon]